MPRRYAILALIAAIAASVAVWSAQAAHEPPHGQPGVSAGVPYIAPWQAGFHRGPTRLITLSNPFFNEVSTVVPAGEWWRIVWVSTAYTASATAGTRFVFLRVQNPAGDTVMQAGTPVNLVASTTATFLYGPNLTTFANSAAAAAYQISVALPDTLWPPGFTILQTVNNAQAGDSFATIPRTIAAEVYTVIPGSSTEQIEPLSVPTPVLG